MFYYLLFMKKIINKFSVRKMIGAYVLLAMLGVMILPSLAMAASITSAKATFGRLKASTASDSVVVNFVTPTGIQTGGADTITLTFSADFTLAAESATNFDIGLGDSGTCSTASYTDETVVTTGASATEWNVDVTGQVITFSPETDDTLSAGFCIRFEMGTAATTGGTGSASTISNGAVDDDDTITVGGAFGDSGTIDIPLVDDDQVNITASVNSSITFDLDAVSADTCGSTENGTPYDVPLGTVTTTDTRVSGTTDTIKHICVDLDTNASGGAIVTVKNANGSSGLVSTSVPADDIDSTDGSVGDGTENYGLCIVTTSATTGTLDDSELGGYDGDTCAANSETNNVQALSTTPETIFDTNGAPIAGGRGQIAVNASITGVQAAHTDYTDTLTFIATGTF